MKNAILIITFLGALIFVAAYAWPHPDVAGMILSSREIRHFTDTRPEQVGEQELVSLQVDFALKTEPKENAFIQSVPFTPQAPRAQWENPRFQDGCEEASILMAMRWVNGQPLDTAQAEEEILALSSRAEELFGFFEDSSAADTAELLRAHYEHENLGLAYDIDYEDVLRQLDAGRLVLLPANGQRLGNPNFTAPGPERHMVLVRGFDAGAREFITNDPGTRNGEGYRYSYEALIGAVVDYPTGFHVPIDQERTALIWVGK